MRDALQLPFSPPIGEGHEHRPGAGPSVPAYLTMPPWLFAALAVLFALTAGLAAPRFGLLTLALPLAGALALGVSARPIIGMALFIALLYSRGIEAFANALHIGSLPLAPAAALSLVALVALQDRALALRRLRLAEWWPLLLYGLALVASIGVARDPQLSLVSVIDYAKNLTYIAALVVCVRRPSELRAVLWALIVAGLIPAAITIVQVITRTTGTFLGLGRWSSQEISLSTTASALRPAGPVGDPNAYALTLVVLLPLVVYAYRHARARLERITAGIAAAAIVAAALLTYSRGAYLTLAILLLVLLAARFVSGRFVAAVLLVGILALPFLPGSYVTRITSIAQAATAILPGQGGTGVSDPSIVGRSSYVWAGAAIIRDHPILGIGTNNFPLYYQEYARPLGVVLTRDARAPHDLYLEVATETGLLGAAAFGVLVLSLCVVLRRCWRTSGQSQEMRELALAVALALFGYLVGSIFLHSAFWRFAWLLVGFALACHGAMRSAAIQGQAPQAGPAGAEAHTEGAR